MLDDDNRPLKPISLDTFITSDGKYNAYFFNNLLEWNHKGTEYDIGQQNMKNVLSQKNYELLSYSSHAPQIINKTIFKEVVDEFFEIGLKRSIDEWSIYFNYAISLYPNSFNKKVFQTINWPETPYQWDIPYIQDKFKFENFYETVYETKFFTPDMTFEDKISLKQKQLKPFLQTKQLFQDSQEVYKLSNMVHGICKFENEDIELYLSNIPYFVVVKKDSDIRLKLNYKLINKTSKKLNISLAIFLNTKPSTQRVLNALQNDTKYQESIIEIPILSKNLKDGIYNISFHILTSNSYIYPKTSPYNTKLIVTSQNDIKKICKHNK